MIGNIIYKDRQKKSGLLPNQKDNNGTIIRPPPDPNMPATAPAIALVTVNKTSRRKKTHPLSGVFPVIAICIHKTVSVKECL